MAAVGRVMIGGCGWSGNDGWLWLREYWLVRSLLAVIGWVVVGYGWLGDAWLWLVMVGFDGG